MSNVVAMPRHAEKWPKIGKKSGLPLANDPKNFAVAIAGVGLKFRMNAFDG